MENETVLEYCTTDYWAWVCTDRRIIRYRSGSGGAEELHDLSFEEVSAISLMNTGRNDKLGGYGAFAIVVGIVGLFLTVYGWPVGWFVSVVSFGIGAYLIHRWRNSESSHFEFRGSGMLQSADEEWKIDQTSADNPSDVQEFVRTVRSQLSK